MFIIGGKEMKSREGTTQGDPISMAAYGIGLKPLLDRLNLNNVDNDLKQVAFADDISGIGRIVGLKKWWNCISEYGPFIGYFPKASKSWLTVKEEYLELEEKIFLESGVNITVYGRKHLGALIGSEQFKKEYIGEKVVNWINQIDMLSKIAKIQPHAAYSCFVKGLSHKFTYVMRTVPDISELLLPLDEAVDRFIRVLFNNYEFNRIERNLWSLPARKGGMALLIPSQISNDEYNNSRFINETLIKKVYDQDEIFEVMMDQQVKKVKAEIKK